MDIFREFKNKPRTEKQNDELSAVIWIFSISLLGMLSSDDEKCILTLYVNNNGFDKTAYIIIL